MVLFLSKYKDSESWLKMGAQTIDNGGFSVILILDGGCTMTVRNSRAIGVRIKNEDIAAIEQRANRKGWTFN